MKYAILISCEHAVSDIPADYRKWFRSDEAKKALHSHRGYDEGALDLAFYLKEALSLKSEDCLHAGTISRLLIDLNRSEKHRSLFSEFTEHLPFEEKSRLIREFHRPYRSAIIDALRKRMDAENTVIHLSVHSFTPVLNGKVRRPDIALLYDPRRQSEKAFADLWIDTFKQESEKRRLFLHTGRNNPYRGTADGCTTAMRRLFPEERYIGIEIEVNQRLLAEIPKAGKRTFPDELKAPVICSLLTALHSGIPGRSHDRSS